MTCPNPACPSKLAAGTVYFPSTVKANPLVANTTSWVSQGTSLYNALEVDVRRSFGNGLQFRGNYTWSKNLDNGSAWNTSVSGNTPAFVSNPFSSKADWGPAATDVRHLASINGTYDLPFGHGGLSTSSAFANRAISGWTVSTIAALQSGFPFTPQLGYNPTGSGDTRNPVRPDVNPNFHGNLYPGTPTQFFNPAAFLTPAAGTIGNLRRDTLTGPSLINLDASLLKATQLTEHVRAQFRAEFFNVLNRTNFATPNPVIYSSGPTPTTLTASLGGQPDRGGDHSDVHQLAADSVRSEAALLALRRGDDPASPRFPITWRAQPVNWIEQCHLKPQLGPARCCSQSEAQRLRSAQNSSLPRSLDREHESPRSVRGCRTRPARG